MKIFSEIIALPDFIKSPMLVLGVQDIEKSEIPGVIPDEFKFDTLTDLLQAGGIDCDDLDPFDKRALFQYNLNSPLPETWNEEYTTVIDYGTIEHIFDTRMVFENCMRMLKVGGHYMIHTPVRNFGNHGLYTFHPELIPRVMRANGFEVIYERYTNSSGVDIDMENDFTQDVIGWYVGVKKEQFTEFKIVEQSRYEPK